MGNESSKIVYIVGHTNPDTDSVCSAIGYAHFKNLTDKRFLFTPARAGKISEETAFILNRFNVPMPSELESLSANVNDLSLKRPIAANARDSIQSLAVSMRDIGVRALPVVDDTGR